MKRKALFILILLIGYGPAIQGQILKKLKKKVKEVSEKVTEGIENAEKVPCLFSDKDCIEKAEQEGKEVVYTGQSSGSSNSKIPSSTGNKELIGIEQNNSFSAGTKHDIYKVPSKKFKISENGKSIAHLDFEGSRKVVKVNGKPDPLPDDVSFDYFQFSPSGKRYAYIAQFGSECNVVIDGKKSKTVPCPGRSSGYGRYRGQPLFYFSGDDLNLVYFYPKGNNNFSSSYNQHVVTFNEKELPGLLNKASAIKRAPPIIAKGNNIYFTLSEEDILKFFKNGVKEASYDELNYLTVSNDGEHYAYAARNYNTENDGQKIVIDGKEYPMNNQNLGYFTMDENNGLASYMDHNILKVNGKPVSEDLDLRKNSAKAIFSKNGKGQAVIYESRNRILRQSRIHTNGKTMPPFEDIKEIGFTSDGNSLVYIASNGGKHFVIENEKEIGPFDSAQDLIFSEEGNSYAFKGRTERGGRFFWYVNGKKIAPAQGPIIFSKDGSRYAFLSSAEGDYNSPHAWIIDGELHTGRIGAFFSKDQTSQSSNNFIFNPVNNNLAYVIKDNYDQGLWRDVVIYGNKKLSGIEQSTRFYKPIFSDDGENMSLFMRNNVSSQSPLIKLFINMKPGPILGQPEARTGNYPFEFADFLDNKTFRTVGLEGEELHVYTISF